MQKNKHRKQNKNICSDLITKVQIKCKYPTTYIFITGNEQMTHNSKYSAHVSISMHDMYMY